MALLKIAELGTETLRKKAYPVTQEEIKTKEFGRFIDDFVATLRDADGAGLSAPQIYVPKRVILVQEPERPLRILINPEIVEHSSEIVEDWEGCLSFNFLRGRVPRYKEITLKAWDHEGDPATIKTQGLLARIIQHEIDHLDGILYLDRMRDMTSLMTLEMFEKMMKNKMEGDKEKNERF